MRRVVTAREQVAMLSPWRVGGPVGLPPRDFSKWSGDQLKDRLFGLQRKHRTDEGLDPDEDFERHQVAGYANSLKSKWNNMEPMSPAEDAHHAALFPGHHRDPAQMSDRKKGYYFAELSTKDPALHTPRERQHLEGMADWAQGHFGNMQNDAQDELGRWDEYRQYGTHPGGAKSLEGTEDAHRHDLTGAWASEIHANKHGGHLGQRAAEYHDALAQVAEKGPLSPTKWSTAHQRLDTARDNMRIELQHKKMFDVPDTSHLSRLDPDDTNNPVSHGTVNPRYEFGMGGKTQAARDAYKVNCQRCVLAADSRHRGYNVEARPNYSTNRNSPHSDESFGDHDIANFFVGPDGNGLTWNDVQDTHGHIPLGPGHWDAMTDQIHSYGPGARGIVAMSYKTGNSGNYNRHVVNFHVGDEGVNYYDTQSGAKDVGDKWRGKTAYGMHPQMKSIRAQASQFSDPELSRRLVNNSVSPLRFLRTDNAELHPQASRHMVDRGGATDMVLHPSPTDAEEGLADYDPEKRKDLL